MKKIINIYYAKNNQASMQIIDEIYRQFSYDVTELLTTQLKFEINLYNCSSEYIDISYNYGLHVIIVSENFFKNYKTYEKIHKKLVETHQKILVISLSKNTYIFEEENKLIVDPKHIRCELTRIMCVIGQKLCDEKIKIFLSYYRSEAQEICKKIVEKLQLLPDYYAFMDIKDISFSSNIQKEICNSLKNSVLLCISTSQYSERFWGINELLTAKKYDIPIVIADCLFDVEYRRNPNMSNAPVIRYDEEISTEIVMRTALLLVKEHLKKQIFISSGKAKLDNTVLNLWRSPELSDFAYAFNKNCNTINYPAPPICKCETEYYNSLYNISLQLDNNMNNIVLDPNLAIGISFAEGEVNTNVHKNYSESLAAEIIRYLIYNNCQIIYGGDWRKGGFTETIKNYIKIYQTRHKDNNATLINHFANLNNENIDLLQGGLFPFGSIVEYRPEPNDDISCAELLSRMRCQMIKSEDALIVIGGKINGKNGYTSGIAEEVAIALEMKKPVYILGSTGGAAQKIADIFNGERYIFNPNSNSYKAEKETLRINSILHSTNIQKISKDNNLSEVENKILFESNNIDLVIRTVFKGLAYIKK